MLRGDNFDAIEKPVTKIFVLRLTEITQTHLLQFIEKTTEVFQTGVTEYNAKPQDESLSAVAAKNLTDIIQTAFGCCGTHGGSDYTPYLLVSY